MLKNVIKFSVCFICMWALPNSSHAGFLFKTSESESEKNAQNEVSDSEISKEEKKENASDVSSSDKSEQKGDQEEENESNSQEKAKVEEEVNSNREDHESDESGNSVLGSENELVQDPDESKGSVKNADTNVDGDSKASDEEGSESNEKVAENKSKTDTDLNEEKKDDVDGQSDSQNEYDNADTSRKNGTKDKGDKPIETVEKEEDGAIIAEEDKKEKDELKVGSETVQEEVVEEGKDVQHTDILEAAVEQIVSGDLQQISKSESASVEVNDAQDAQAESAEYLAPKANVEDTQKMGEGERETERAEGGEKNLIPSGEDLAGSSD